jgi:uncharacterized membrane-anchored protein
MTTLFKKPYLFFFPASLLMAALGFLIPPASIDFNIQDTYYVIANTFGFHLFALLGLFMAYGYWTIQRAKKQLSYRLNVLHVLISSLGPMMIWITSLFYRDALPISKNVLYDLNHNDFVGTIIICLVLITLLVQLVFPVNVIRSLWKEKKKKKD